MDTFKFLLRVAKSNFSTARGVIVNLRSKTVRTPLSLCLSTRRNKGKLVPTDCILWEGEKALYEGPVNSKRLANKLAKLQLCCAEVTNAEDMERGIGEFICMGDPKTCTCTSCKCRSESYYTKLKLKYPELGKDVIIVENNVIKKMVTDAWENGFRVAKARFWQGVKKWKKQYASVTGLRN